jgi:hypothetical protein
MRPVYPNAKPFGERGMQVTLETHVLCPCGARIRTIMVATVRVNRRSMRTIGPMIGFLDHTQCPQCGAEIVRGEMPREAYRLMPDDAAKIAEYRRAKWGIDA